jgi:hypothetical protein
MIGEHIGRYPSADGYVFTAPDGGPIRHRNFSRRHFRPAVKRPGLPTGLRFHDLRDTCAALLIASGAHMEEVKRYLGHSTIRVTSDRYGHLFPSADDALRARLDQTFRDSAADSSRTRHAEKVRKRRQRPQDGPLTSASLERTTGLEPATLTLAR